MTVGTLVWGTGLLAERALKRFDIQAVGFLDNNKTKWGTLKDGLPVHQPTRACIAGHEIIIASIHYFDIHQQLLALDANPNTIRIASEETLLTPYDSTALIERHRTHLDWINSVIATQMPSARDFGADRDSHLRHAVAAATGQGLVLEFGVYMGCSLRILADAAQQPVVGFDTFEGLPENWTLFHPQNFFDLKGALPQLDDDVTLVKGLFQDTLTPFLAEHDEPVRLLHCDADLYSSTSYVLEACAPRIQVGTVLIFDDYLYDLDYDQCDYRALTNFCASQSVQFEYLSREASGSVAVKITAKTEP